MRKLPCVFLCAMLVACATQESQGERGSSPASTSPSVLYLEGEATWQARYLAAMLRRQGSRVVFTRDAHRGEAALGDLDRYEVVILGDVRPEFLARNEGFASQLAQFVRDGGGLVLLARTKPDLPRSIATLAPVRFEGAAHGAAGVVRTTRREDARVDSLRVPANRGAPHARLSTVRRDRGRVVYVGLTETWRWRAGGDDSFERFWTRVCTAASGR